MAKMKKMMVKLDKLNAHLNENIKHVLNTIRLDIICLL